VADDAVELADGNVFMVTAPTAADASRRPDPGSVLAVSETVGRALCSGDVVVYQCNV